jgi:hypothetical protein
LGKARDKPWADSDCLGSKGLSDGEKRLLQAAAVSCDDSM